MKKLSRRELLKLMGLTAASGVLAACGAQATEAPAETEGAAETEEAAEPKDEAPKAEPVVVTFVESWFGVPQFAESIEPVTTAISAAMQEAGLNIEIRSMLLDDHEAKYPLLYSSGADFTCAFDAPWYKMGSLIDQRAIMPVEDLMKEYGPDVISSTGQEIVDFNFQEGPDGNQHLYGIPARFYYSGTTGVILREDLREKYGAPEPTSAGGYASLEPYLEAVKENEGGMIPFANRPAYPMVNTNALALHNWGGGPGFTVPDIFEGTTFVKHEELEWMKVGAALARKWYELGYVPQEAISSDYDVLNDYYNVEKTACFQDNEPEYKAYEKGKATAEAVPGAKSRGFDLSGKRATKQGMGNLKQWNFVVFNANAPDEQKAAGMQFFNWLTSSQDHADMWLMGVEGVNYKAEANKRFSDIEGADPTRNYRRQWYVSGITGEFQRQPMDLTPDAEEALKFYTTKENWKFTPFAKFNPSTKEIETEINAITAANDEAFFAIGQGSLPVEDSLPTYTQMLDDAGRERVMEWYQEKLDAWIAENKDYIDSFDTGM